MSTHKHTNTQIKMLQEIESCCTFVRYDLPHSLKHIDYTRDTYVQYTHLHIAAQYNHIDCAKMLLKHGANVNACDNWQNTPLHFAKSFDMVQLLLQHGANINAQNVNKETVATYFVRNGKMDVINFLKENGADILL